LQDRITDRLRSATPVMSEDTLLPFDQQFSFWWVGSIVPRVEG
jgi:hypothetical protein